MDWGGSSPNQEDCHVPLVPKVSCYSLDKFFCGCVQATRTKELPSYERTNSDYIRSYGLSVVKSSECPDLCGDYWDFGICISSGILKNTTFRKLDLFPSSGWGGGTPTLLGPLERANLNHWPPCVSIATAIYTREIRVCQR
jgi:hypothetical protein